MKHYLRAWEFERSHRVGTMYLSQRVLTTGRSQMKDEALFISQPSRLSG